MRSRRSRPTPSDITAEAGVSTATGSKVLNGRTDVASATKGAGDRAAEEHNDLPLCQWGSPPLTTVRQPLEEMGRTAARALFQQLDGELLVSPRIELTTELRVRLSTAPPPA